MMKTIEKAEAARLVAEGSTMTHKERLAVQNKRLAELVRYARENSPYFRKLYGGLSETPSLSELPITEKSELMAHYEDWVTDRGIRLPEVKEYCERKTTDSVLFLDKYSVLHTSGTTGDPLYMVRDDHRNKIHGQMIAQRLMKGVDTSVMDSTRHRIAAVIYTERGASTYEGLLRQKNAFPEYADNLRWISVLGSIDEITAELNEFRPEVMTGYGSVLTALALEKQAGRLDIPVKVIFNSAEVLLPQNHALIEKAFGCPVKNNYCMTEGGEVAMTVDGPDLLLNEDWIIVEPVNDKREPVTDPNEWSGGILITDLANFVQPIIRYYVSDSIRIEHTPDDSVRMPRLEIHGRVNACFTLAGKTFSSSGLDSITELRSGIQDYQFVQISDCGLELRAVCGTGYDPDEVMSGLRGEVEAYFKGHGCPDAIVTYTLEPPVKNTRGGKTPRFIDLRK